MRTNRQTFRNNAPASATCLGRIGRVHGDDWNTSAFSLVFQHLPEQSEASIMRRKGQVSVSVHKAEGKVFDSNQVILSYKPVADLVQIIRSLIRDLLVQASNLPVGFTLAVASLDLPGSMTGKATEFRKVLSQPAGVFNQLPTRKGGEAFQTDIHTYLLSRLDRSLFGFGQLEHQADMPPFPNPLDHGVLDFSLGRDGSMVAHLYFTDVLKVERPAALLVPAQLATVAVGILDALEAIAPLEAWITGGLTRF